MIIIIVEQIEGKPWPGRFICPGLFNSWFVYV